jgi:hypothetical protein
VPGDVLTRRELNRALLERQGLLARSATAALAMVERLVGMQAQVPENPYVALWSRIAGFDPEELSRAVAERAAVRAGLMRSTIHLVSARDYLTFRPVTAPLMARTFRSPFLAGLAGVELEAVVAAGRELVAEQPRTRAELSALLARRWPEADPAALGHAVTFNVPLVQVPPRGLWGGRGQATWADAEAWLGERVDAGATADGMVLRYLAAFGPATVADVRTWSGVTGLRSAVQRLRPGLRTFRDEQGRELLDVPDGPLPDPGTPAPPRFLPEYDNLLLSHADRSRVLAGLGPGLPAPEGGTKGSLLVDGLYRAFWRLADGVLTIDRFTPLPGDPPGTVGAIAEEAEALLAFLAPEAGGRVEFVPALA